MSETLREAAPAVDAADPADAELAAGAGAGDREAFRVLYRRHVRAVYWICHGILGDPGEAEEATQEAFLVAWRKLPGLDLLGDSLLPWLATIGRYQAANRLRRQRRDRAHAAGEPEEDLPATGDVLAEVIAGDLGDRIVRALGDLGDLDREIFLLCAVEGYGYREAAAHLGVPLGSVRNRLSRARTQLRGALTETEDS